MAKLTRVHIVIIFVVVYAIVGVGLYWFMIKPKNEEKAKAQSEYQARLAVANTLGQRQAELADAQKKKAETERKHDRYVRAYMPANIRDLSPVNQRKYLKAVWDETMHGTGPVMERFARTLPVTMQYRFQIPAAPLDPHLLPTDPIATPIKWQFKDVTCVGSYPNILKYLRAWVNCPRLVRIDSLRLEGESPYVTCVTDMTVFIFLRKEQAGEPEVQVEPYLAGGGTGGGGYGGGGPGTGAGGPSMPGPAGGGGPVGMTGGTR
jgi:Tfp pilus assembly protein PilO